MKHARGFTLLCGIGIVTLLVIVGILKFANDGKNGEEMYIYEIPYTHVYAPANHTDYRFFVVCNPCKSEEELSAFVYSFCADFWDANGYNQTFDTQNDRIRWRFYRETHLISKEWIKNGVFFQDGQGKDFPDLDERDQRIYSDHYFDYLDDYWAEGNGLFVVSWDNELVIRKR